MSLKGHLILNDISWTLGRGELWHVSGSNGAGKSTFLRLLKGDLWPDPQRGGRRRYNFDGNPTEILADLKARIAWVSPEQQERYWRQEWEVSCRAVIESGFSQTDYPGQTTTPGQSKIVSRISNLLGVAHLWPRNAQTLSQGELRRILIARALVSKPLLLLLDEATHGLDTDSRKRLFKALEDVSRDGTTVVFASHRPEEWISCGGRLLRIENGRILPINSRAVARFAATRAAAIQASAKKVGIPFPNQAPPKKARVSDLPALPEPINTSRNQSRAEGRTPNVIQPEALVALEGVTVYLHRKPIIRNLDWTIYRGEHWAVVGANGSGKSTLIKTLVGDLHPAWGGRASRFEAEKLSTLWEVRARIGYVAADFQSAYEGELTAREVVASGISGTIGVIEKLAPAQWTLVQQALEEFHLRSIAKNPFNRLSYGQRRQVLLARAAVHGPHLVVLDEPFDGLDAPSRQSWLLALGRLARRGASIVLVTHHEDDVPVWFTHALRLRDGTVVFRGPLSKPSENSSESR